MSEKHEIYQEEIDSQFELDEEINNNDLMGYDMAIFYNTYNLSTLMKWWGKKLVVPDFQRSYVWNQKKASEFVDSMLRGLPVPSMFFYDDIDNSRLLVVDGQQRLQSLYMYKDGKFLGNDFNLIGNIHSKWKDKKYDELDETDRDRLDDALMNITVMRQLAPDDGQSAMYLAFQRINTGGKNLRAQEIRMAVSFGPLAKYLDDLSGDDRFKKWKFLRTDSQRKSNDYSSIQELILKFWTYYIGYPDGFAGTSTRVLLDDFFDTQKDFDEPKRKKEGKKYYSKVELETIFNATFDIVNSLEESDLSPYTKPTQTFLEAVWVGLTYRKLVLNMHIDVEKLPNHIKKWKDTIGNEEFSRLFQARRTSSVKSAFERINAGIIYFGGDFNA